MSNFFCLQVQTTQDQLQSIGDPTLKMLAQAHDLPVVWYRLGTTYAVVVAGEVVLRQKTLRDAFIVYMSTFPLFDIDWNKLVKVREFRLHYQS